MKFHPYAEVFPLLEGAAFDDLVYDIQAHGLREKIWLYDGKILDGRNRYRACQKAKVKPGFRKYAGKDPLAFVVSLNVQRRHLTVEQRGFAAARIATLQKGGDPNASREALTQDEAAEKLDVSRSTVQRARQVIEKGSKALQHAVESGNVPLKKAAAVVDLPKAEQLAAATAERKAPEVADYVPDEKDEDAAIERAAQEMDRALDAVMASDDRFAAMKKEMERLAALVGVLEKSRDHYMGQAQEAVKIVKSRDREITKLKKELEARKEAA